MPITDRLIDNQRNARYGAFLMLALLAACAAPPGPPVITPPAPPVIPPVASYVASQWEVLPDWNSLDLQQTRAAFWQSCRVLNGRPAWQAVCARNDELAQAGNDALRAFFEENFIPYQILNPDGSPQGMITGYYEAKLNGSRTRTSRFRYPLYGVPDDLLGIDLGQVYPQLKDLRLRGRMQGRSIVPYFKRAEIEAGKAALHGRELFWVDNAIDLFFLHIQGSGRIELPDGSLAKVGYADQNGHPYISIGRKLIEMGELKLEEASMQGIKSWAARHPEKLQSLLAQNPSYVFFRELPDGLSAPLGAQGVPLTELYSLAVDPRTVPLGAPVFLATTYPNTGVPLNRLMVAQDTGGAIKGAVRADFFWGFGEQAEAQAGRMKQSGKMWVLLPRGMELPSP